MFILLVFAIFLILIGIAVTFEFIYEFVRGLFAPELCMSYGGPATTRGFGLSADRYVFCTRERGHRGFCTAELDGTHYEWANLDNARL